jgi:hypothetical protein
MTRVIRLRFYRAGDSSTKSWYYGELPTMLLTNYFHSSLITFDVVAESRLYFARSCYIHKRASTMYGAEHYFDILNVLGPSAGRFCMHYLRVASSTARLRMKTWMRFLAVIYRLVRFLRWSQSVERSIIAISILSVCLSVCLSVTLLGYAKTVRDSALVTMGS